MYLIKYLIGRTCFAGTYILGALRHTTAFYQNWGSDETLTIILINVAPRSLRVTQIAYFSLLTHTEQLLLVTFCDTTAEIRASFQMD